MSLEECCVVQWALVASVERRLGITAGGPGRGAGRLVQATEAVEVDRAGGVDKDAVAGGAGAQAGPPALIFPAGGAGFCRHHQPVLGGGRPRRGLLPPCRRRRGALPAVAPFGLPYP